MDTATHEIELPASDPVAHEIEDSGQEHLSLELGDRKRLLELAAAVRAHQANVSGQVGSARPHDVALYRRLRQSRGSGWPGRTATSHEMATARGAGSSSGSISATALGFPCVKEPTCTC